MRKRNLFSGLLILIIFSIIILGIIPLWSIDYKGQIKAGKWLRNLKVGFTHQGNKSSATVQIYFPKGYEKGDNLRTIIALHNYSGHHRSWETETYITNLQRYLQDGIFRDSRYGPERQNSSKLRCVAMAYYPDGTPKRTPGVYYADMGCEYTNEMAAEDYARARQAVSNKKRVRKTS